MHALGETFSQANSDHFYGVAVGTALLGVACAVAVLITAWDPFAASTIALLCMLCSLSCLVAGYARRKE